MAAWDHAELEHDHTSRAAATALAALAVDILYLL